MNLEVVLADGRILYTGGKNKRPRKSSAGYNLTNIMIGSEGTLGIITKSTVKLHAQPEAIAAAVVNFPDIKSAVDTVVTTLQCSLPMARYCTVQCMYTCIYSAMQKPLYSCKTTLITSSVSGIGVNPPFFNLDRFFLRSLALSMPIRRNFQSNGVKWRSIKL